MPLSKQPVNINFGKGLDTKTDLFQIPIGNFSALVNSIFTKGGRLQKRNGFGSLPSLPDGSNSYATTFNGDLTAIGTSLNALAFGSQSWVNKGSIQPLSLSTLPLIRNNLNQTQADSAISANGFICTAYTEVNAGTPAYKYVVADSTTGQNIVAPMVISGADTADSNGTPRVFLVGNYFIIVYTNKVSSTYHLKFIAISVNNPASVTAPADISTSYTPAATLSFDGVALNSSLYLAWNGASSSGVKMAYITPSLSVTSAVTRDASHSATVMSLCADIQNQVIWATYYNSGTSTGYTLAVDPQLNLLTHFPAQVISTGTILNISTAAKSGTLTVFYETSHTDNSIQTNFISSLTVIQSSGTVSAATVSLRSVGLASKAFIYSGSIYFLAAYSSPFQPTYFLVSGSVSTSASPVIVAKLAYENGGGYLGTGTPLVTVSGSTASVAYLYKDLIEALSDANSEGTVTVGGVYSQTGVNLVTFEFGSQGLVTSEIGSNLNITGGYLQGYDGYSLTEQGFHIWPSSVQNTATATTGGHLAAQIYYAQFTYEWTDNQGNAFRSAGSIPVQADLSASMTATNTLTWVVPTLRLTSKVSNPVKIVGYRWSTAQQTFYQFTSITAPVLNDTTIDSVTIVDTLADSTIVGNNILYTTGGVIEDTGAPASSATTLFDDRLWLVDAEDPNLLWFSKQVIESTPVEMSDLLTVYVAPTIGSQGSTGPVTALGAMDDKLIIFKQDAIYYINGTGPDNAGANSQYSQPIFITASVGCANQRSIVLCPEGLLFQSDKGIWLLGRDLATQYLGAPVEKFNSTLIQGALGVPGTNQDRFTASSGICQMYDYYYQQWGTFSNVPAVSSTLFKGNHTYISSVGQVFQETPGLYLDGTTPVLMNLTTGWLNLAGLQGYQRAFFFYLLGTYYTPFKLVCSIAYDYEASPSHFATINPTNFAPNYGSPEANGQNTVYGSDSPYGGPGNVLKWRVFLNQQRCTAIQIGLQEVYDPSFNVPAGQGFSLSGLQVIVAIKSAFTPISNQHSVGAS